MNLDFLQILMLSLEIIGISLALIELRSPQLADKIEAFLLRAEPITDGVIKGLFNKKLQDSPITPAHYAANNEFLALLFFIVLLPVLLINLLIKFLNRFSKGRGLGSLGLLLAIAGGGLEVYQTFYN